MQHRKASLNLRLSDGLIQVASSAFLQSLHVKMGMIDLASMWTTATSPASLLVPVTLTLPDEAVVLATPTTTAA